MKKTQNTNYPQGITQAKHTYENTPIPEELAKRMQCIIPETPPFISAKKTYVFPSPLKIVRYAACFIFVICTLFILGLNTSSSFAKEMSDLPVLGTLARVFTFRTYQTTKENIDSNVTIPAVELPDEETAQQKEANINAAIQGYVSAYEASTLQIMEEYKTAFLETGGTIEEWNERDIKITVGYEILHQSTDYLSFLVYGTQNQFSAYQESQYYTIDLKTYQDVTLSDLLGNDYINLANESILSQMQERMAADPSLTYFDESMDGFTSITDESKFYINEKGNPVIVFDKYEVAPGAFGPQEFEIQKP